MPNQHPVVIDPSGRDIHAENARIRGGGPVARVELPGGLLAWSVTGRDVAMQLLTDPRISKDARRHWPPMRDGELSDDFPMLGWVAMDNLTTAYGEDHARLRRLTQTAFSPRRIGALRPHIEKAVARLLSELATEPPGAVVDLKARYAKPLPAEIICDLFGVPPESRAEVLRGGEANVDTTATPEEAAANVERWHQEMHDFVEAKRRSPGDDLTSDLVAAQEEDGSRLSDSEMVGTLHLLLAAGAEPPMNLLTNAVFELLRHPDQLAAVRAGELTWDAVIAETLRHQAPVAHLPFRFAVTDIDIAGVTLRAGDPLLINFAAIGRDPEVHGRTADVFEVARAEHHHLSFGHGAHRCIGSALALREAAIALPELFLRFPRMALAVPPDEVAAQTTFIMNGRAHLPVRLVPA